MKTVIIFTSKHGTTKKISELIKLKLKDEKEVVEVVDLKKIKDYNLRVFDRIIIGGSIHAGTVSNSLKKFCKDNSGLLLEKQLGLFIVCMLPDEKKREEQLNNSFSDELRRHSKAKGILGGEFLFEEMNFVEKLMVKIIAKTSKTTSKIDDVAIDKFVRDLVEK